MRAQQSSRPAFSGKHSSSKACPEGSQWSKGIKNQNPKRAGYGPSGLGEIWALVCLFKHCERKKKKWKNEGKNERLLETKAKYI